ESRQGILAVVGFCRREQCSPVKAVQDDQAAGWVYEVNDPLTLIVLRTTVGCGAVEAKVCRLDEFGVGSAPLPHIKVVDRSQDARRVELIDGAEIGIAPFARCAIETPVGGLYQTGVRPRAIRPAEHVDLDEAIRSDGGSEDGAQIVRSSLQRRAIEVSVCGLEESTRRMRAIGVSIEVVKLCECSVRSNLEQGPNVALPSRGCRAIEDPVARLDECTSRVSAVQLGEAVQPLDGA